MTQSLNERLQAKLEDQTAEIASLTESELKKLSARVQSSVSAELSDIETAIARATSGMLDEIPRLKWIVGLTWAALMVSLCLMSFLLWRSAQTPPLPVAPEPFEVFRSEGRDYLMIPQGSNPAKCQDSSGAERLCLRLPQERN